MSPVPTMSVRCSPEHHQLIRSLARALRERPQLASVIAAMLAKTDASPSLASSPDLAAVLARLDVIERWIAEQGTGVTNDGPPLVSTSQFYAISMHSALSSAEDQEAPLGGDDVDAGGTPSLSPDNFPLWLVTKGGRKLSEHGKRVMSDMKKSGARSKVIAALFDCEPQNVARLLWKLPK